MINPPDLDADLTAALARATAGYALKTAGASKGYAAYRSAPIGHWIASMTASSLDEAWAGFLADCRTLGIPTSGVSIEPWGCRP